MHKKFYSIATLASATIGGLAAVIYNIGCQRHHPYSTSPSFYQQAAITIPFITGEEDEKMALFCHALFYISTVGAFSTIVL